MILRRTLQTRPKNAPRSTQSNRLDTSNLLAYPTSSQCTDQSPQIIHRNNPPLQQTIRYDRSVGRAIDSLNMTESHELDVVFGVIDTAHHALIIAEEEDGETGYAIDCNEKLAFLQRVRDVPFLDLVAHLDGCGFDTLGNAESTDDKGIEVQRTRGKSNTGAKQT